MNEWEHNIERPHKKGQKKCGDIRQGHMPSMDFGSLLTQIKGRDRAWCPEI